MRGCLIEVACAKELQVRTGGQSESLSELETCDGAHLEVGGYLSAQLKDGLQDPQSCRKCKSAGYHLICVRVKIAGRRLIEQPDEESGCFREERRPARVSMNVDLSLAYA